MSPNSGNTEHAYTVQHAAETAARGFSWFIVAIILIWCYVGLILALNVLATLIFRDPQRERVIELSAVAMAAIAPLCAGIGLLCFVNAGLRLSGHIQRGLLLGCLVLIVTSVVMTVGVFDVLGFDLAEYHQHLALVVTLLPIAYACAAPFVVRNIRNVLIACDLNESELTRSAWICTLWSIILCTLAFIIIGHNTVQLWGGPKLMPDLLMITCLIAVPIALVFPGWLLRIAWVYRSRCRDIVERERDTRL